MKRIKVLQLKREFIKNKNAVNLYLVNRKHQVAILSAQGMSLETRLSFNAHHLDFIITLLNKLK